MQRYMVRSKGCTHAGSGWSLVDDRTCSDRQSGSSYVFSVFHGW
jgi:hypothetical protein